LVSRVAPSSNENACSHVTEVGVMFFQSKRTRAR
jgi:hypothetical protein